MASIKSVLIISPFFSPNIGGVESHLDDLVTQLNLRRLSSYVITYSPLTTQTNYQHRQKIGRCHITRLPWISGEFFNRFEKHPFLQFTYLTPYLFLATFFWLLKNHRLVSLIHSHGFNAAIIGVTLGSLFHLPHLCSTHAVYENLHGTSRKLVTSVLRHCHLILCLSRESQRQLLSWGINPQKISLYQHWINLKYFIPAKSKPSQTALFAARMIPKKGLSLVLKLATAFPNWNFLIVGNGPLEDTVVKFANIHKNIHYLGKIPYSKMPQVYQRASIFLTASLYPEGYGRALMEAVACGLPVVGSNLGAIPEAVSPAVSILFKPTSKNFSTALRQLSTNPNVLKEMQKNCRPYALKNYSSKNFKLILNAYSRLLDRG